MDQVHVIRHAVLKQGRSRRSVALELGVSRNTVRKYLEESEPRFSAPVGRRQPVLERVKARLDELLAEWSARTTAKQRITGSRLHGQLRMEGFDVGITLVRQYFREWRRQRQETFVPLVHRPGDSAQVDFFEVTVEVNGERRKALMFAMRLMYSGRDYVWLYERCDQLSFLDAHVRAFAHVGGVPRRCVYDNLSAAVRKVVFPRRQLTARFTALSSHYLFEPCFARPGEGHDTGGIESRGKGIRLQHLVPIPRARSLEACGELLHRRIEEQSATRRGRDDKRTVMERFAEEQSALRAIPEVEFDSRKVLPVSAGQTPRVRVEGAWYSVPSTWAGLDVIARVGVSKVELRCRGESVERDRQSFGGKDIRYRDYLPELGRKPQAVRQVAPELVAELDGPFRQLWEQLVASHGDGEAARTLSRMIAAIVEHGEEPVRQALSTALAANRTDLLDLVSAKAEPEYLSVAVPPELAGYEIETSSAADFDVLLEDA